MQKISIQSKGNTINVLHITWKNSTKVCLYFWWAPATRRKGKKIKQLVKKWYEVYTFDYSWWWDSTGNFAPKELISVSQDVYEYVCTVTWKDVICIGSSFWSIIASEVQGNHRLILLAPVLQPKFLWNNEERSEDSIDDFLYGLKECAEYYHGVDYDQWREFLQNFKRTKHAKNVLMIHGKRDKSIHFSRTVEYTKNMSDVTCLYPWYVWHSGASLIRKIPD